MTRDQLTAVGEALYGLRWQSALSRDLNVALRTVQRWDAGERGIPDTLSDDLRALLEQRRIDIDDLLKSI
jgi:hypothetical protein